MVEQAPQVLRHGWAWNAAWEGLISKVLHFQFPLQLFRVSRRNH